MSYTPLKPMWPSPIQYEKHPSSVRTIQYAENLRGFLRPSLFVNIRFYQVIAPRAFNGKGEGSRLRGPLWE